jgi:hypothetical protein
MREIDIEMLIFCKRRILGRRLAMRFLFFTVLVVSAVVAGAFNDTRPSEVKKSFCFFSFSFFFFFVSYLPLTPTIVPH